MRTDRSKAVDLIPVHKTVMLLSRIMSLLRSDKVDSDLERKQMAAYKEESANEKTDAGTPKFKPAIKEPIPETNPDYRVLSGKYGDLEALRGKTISIELHDAAKLLNRRRVKADAFYSLKKNLMNDYGINLNIYNNRRTGK